MRYLLVFAIFVLCIKMSSGQHDYIPFVKGNSFCINFQFLDTDHFPKPSGATLSYFKGDSIYNGKIYGKRYFSGLSGTHPCPLEQRPCFVVDYPYRPIENNYKGLYRDDAAQKTVFFIPKGSLDELEIYNFSLSKGDTISSLLKTILPNEYVGQRTVDSTSFENIFGKLRKVLYLQAKSLYYPFEAFFIEVIEGIGIRCDYCEGTLSDCNVISETNDINIGNKDQIVLYPNPVWDALSLEKSLELQKSVIFDQNGRIVLSSTENEINVSHLLSGHYYIKSLGANNKLYVTRFVKI